MFIFLKMMMILLAVGNIYGQVLSSANLASNVMRSNWRVFANQMGVSMNFQQVITQINNTLFHKYHRNSFFYGNWAAIFHQTCHVKTGTRYKCALIANYTNTNISNCLIQLNNETFLKTLGDYIWNYTNYYGFIVGWDMKDVAFGNSTYLTNIFSDFILTMYKKARQPFIIQLVDKGNQFAQLGFNPNYTAKKLVTDCKSVNSNLYGAVMAGPGATQNASKQWYAQNRDIYWYCGLFSFRAYVFENQAEMNISNLLSQNYTTNFWQRRFVTNDYNVLNDFDKFFGMVNDFRITKDSKGRDGFTNTFAASIFAIEATLQYYFRGGFYISFHNPILQQSFQSPYGQAPNFAPNSLYYSLLFLTLSTSRYPYIEKPKTIAGTSGSIKIYGLRYYGTTYGFIIINKDQSVNATGIVEITLRDNSGVNCLYLQAASLNATQGITFGGVSFIGGNATYQGNFTSFKYGVNQNNNYEIMVNYSQVVFCKTDSVVTNYPFPRGSSKSQLHYYLSFFIIFYFTLLIN